MQSTRPSHRLTAVDPVCGERIHDRRYRLASSLTWRIETVDEAGNVGGFTSLALDSNDRPHISYEHFNYPPRYAWWNGSAWNITTVHANPTRNIGHYTSLALGSDGHRHISYWRLSTGDLFYATTYMIPALESCTASGVPQISFELAEAIAVNGTDFAPSTSYPVYLVVDATWTDGMAMPSRVANTATSIISDANGAIAPTVVWATPLVEGAYDVVVHVNGNGQYDAGVDALDDNSIQVTAGIIVIPELLVPTLLFFTVVTPLVVFIYRTRKPVT